MGRTTSTRAVGVVVAIAVVVMVLGGAVWAAAFRDDPGTGRSPATAGAPTTAGPPGLTTPYGFSEVERVTVLGDSVTTGTTCNCKAFPQLVASTLTSRLGHRVTVADDGADGATTADVRDALRSDETIRSHVKGADVVVLTIGANDLSDLLGRDPKIDEPCPASCYEPRNRTATAAVAALVTAVRSLAPSARVLVNDYWDVSTDGSGVRSDILTVNRAMTASFDAELVTALSGTGAEIVDLVRPFIVDTQGDPSGLLLDDDDHPNAAGHRAIADAVVQVVLHGPTGDEKNTRGPLTSLYPPTSPVTSGTAG